MRMRERTIAGLERARAQGKRLGRPKVVVSRERIHALRDEGKSLSEIAAAVGIGKTSVYRILGSVNGKR